MNEFLLPPVSNGNPREQALIRRWWNLRHHRQGTMVWEYCLQGLYADAIWFPDLPSTLGEEPGKSTAKRFPLAGASVVLCEAKVSLTPEVIGQALVYRWYLQQAGAIVREAFVFAERDSYNRRAAAEALGLNVVLP